MVDKPKELSTSITLIFRYIYLTDFKEPSFTQGRELFWKKMWISSGIEWAVIHDHQEGFVLLFVMDDCPSHPPQFTGARDTFGVDWWGLRLFDPLRCQT